MATKAMKPGATKVTLGFRARFDTDPPLVFTAPGGLIPLRIANFSIDEYRMKNGWPTPIPPMDIRARTLCSASGEKLSQRPMPYQIRTDASVRWVADDQTFDETGLVWRPLQTGLDLDWRSSVEYMPVLVNNYNYRVGSEVFYRDAINFDSDTRNHMWMSMQGVLNPLGYTVIMVLAPNSAYGNDVEVPYNGIWCYGEATPNGEDLFAENATRFMNVTTMGNFVYLESESYPSAKGPGIHDQLISTSPMYLVMSFNRPSAALYAGSGVSSMTKVLIPTGQVEGTLDPSVVLGRSTGDVLHTADMALFDVGIYTKVLTDAEVVSEISKLSRTYGGDT